MREFTLGQISGLLSYVKQHAIDFLQGLFQLQHFGNYADEGTAIYNLTLVEEIAGGVP